MWWYIGLGYFAVGVVFVLILGKAGLFDYTPKSTQFKPETLRNMSIVLWPCMMFLLLVETIVQTIAWLYKKLNEATKIYS